MRKFGLIGYPITHSFSPGYFKKKFEASGIDDARYDLYSIPRIEDFEEIQGVNGLNVTIPYKEAVIPFLDILSLEAEEIGAVNTIFFNDGKKIGYNTDTYGFEKSLKSTAGNRMPDSALVLGTGGAAKAVWYTLEKMGIQYIKVSRSQGDLLYEEINDKIIRNHHLIINTTPLGMSPNLETYPDIPYSAISANHILFDLVYNPEKTLFLKKGAGRGARIQNGLRMLELQADKSWEIWNKT